MSARAYTQKSQFTNVRYGIHHATKKIAYVVILCIFARGPDRLGCQTANLTQMTKKNRTNAGASRFIFYSIHMMYDLAQMPTLIHPQKTLILGVLFKAYDIQRAPKSNLGVFSEIKQTWQIR